MYKVNDYKDVGDASDDRDAQDDIVKTLKQNGLLDIMKDIYGNESSIVRKYKQIASKEEGNKDGKNIENWEDACQKCYDAQEKFSEYLGKQQLASMVDDVLTYNLKKQKDIDLYAKYYKTLTDQNVRKAFCITPEDQNLLRALRTISNFRDSFMGHGEGWPEKISSLCLDLYESYGLEPKLNNICGTMEFILKNKLYENGVKSYVQGLMLAKLGYKDEDLNSKLNEFTTEKDKETWLEACRLVSVYDHIYGILQLRSAENAIQKMIELGLDEDAILSWIDSELLIN